MSNIIHAIIIQQSYTWRTFNCTILYRLVLYARVRLYNTEFKHNNYVPWINAVAIAAQIEILFVCNLITWIFCSDSLT